MHLFVFNYEIILRIFRHFWKFIPTYVHSNSFKQSPPMFYRFKSFVFSVALLISYSSAQGQVTEKQYLLGQFDPTVHPDFIKPADIYTKGSARNQWMRKEAYAAFVKMAKEAKKQGISLVIISATRPFATQKSIWEKKWKEREALPELERAKNILLFSSMPGTSRHHWGSDIDINELSNAYFSQGNGLKEYEWLKKNASKYGFCQTYTSKTDGKRTGYEEEKWHWSYLPLASHFTKRYEKTVQYADINGFLGSDLATELQVIEKYVKGVACP